MSAANPGATQSVERRQREDLDELRARAGAGDRAAAGLLADMLIMPRLAAVMY